MTASSATRRRRHFVTDGLCPDCRRERHADEREEHHVFLSEVPMAFHRLGLALCCWLLVLLLAACSNEPAPTTAERVTEQGGVSHATQQLHPAVAFGNVEMVASLLNQGADIESRIDLGEPNITLFDTPTGYDRIRPLHLAVASCNPEMVALLLDRGADTEATLHQPHTGLTGSEFSRDTGITPLIMAASCNAEVVASLLDAGADTEAKDEDGRTPLDLAEHFKHSAAVELLR